MTAGTDCLAQGQIQLYAFSLDWPDDSLVLATPLLSPAEQARAARFHFALHRRRFVAGRAALRAILSDWLDLHPAKLEFQYSARGKPSLFGAPVKTALEFNLAHSGDLALLAITRGKRIGVDVEELRFLPDFDALVERFFSSRENAAFQNLSPADKTVAFFNLWTRKEAWLKATGDGIGEHLNRVEVSFLPAEPARLLALPPDNGPVFQWQILDLAPATGFAAALAFTGPIVPVNTWRWDPSPGLDKIERHANLL